MVATQSKTKAEVTHSAWFRSLGKYEQPSVPRAVWQLANTLLPYAALWALMVSMLKRGAPVWLLIPPALLAAAFLVRIFIIFHDCGHGSFFASRLANRVVGYACGVLTFTPFDEWRHTHAIHHTTVGDLDRRLGGDVWTLTVDEFHGLPKRQQLVYRVYRHPLTLFVFGPPILFLISQRLPGKGAEREERNSVAITNLAIAAVLAAAWATIGLRTYLLIQIPLMWLAGAAGIWLFYVQHQFEGVYWARHGDWDPIRAAIQGSSYYRLPKVLQWFSGNIGLHHIHHLRPRIPNYNLQRCYDEVPELHVDQPLTLWASLRCLSLNVWDEASKKLVSFSAIARGPRQSLRPARTK